ncbi:glycosyltransferase family 39 protein [Halosegnis rubeus]|nr:glycosyltransferase family 39 protein [Halosegnis rubeus]
MFYVIALLTDIGLSQIFLMQFVPGLVMVLCVVPFYLIASELLQSKIHAGFAASLYALASHTFVTYLGSGGIVRGPAVLFFLCGTYAAIQVFMNDDRRWLVPAGIIFGATLLTHPSHAVRLGLTYVLLFAVFEQSIDGFVEGISTAVIGFGIAAPWLVAVISMHGWSPFIAAFGTFQEFSSQAGLGAFINNVAAYQGAFGQPTTSAPTGQIIWYVTILGSVHLVAKRRLFLPLWFLLTGVVGAAVNLALYAQTMIAAVFFLDAFSSIPEFLQSRKVSYESIILVLFVCSIIVPTAAFSMNTAVDMRETLSDDSMEAMEWVSENTESDATFIVTGGTGEWFPLFTGRTILISRWGAEWDGPDEYRNQNQMWSRVNSCQTADCLQELMQSNNLQPDYIVVSEESLRESLSESEQFNQRYTTSEIVVYKTVGL